MNRRERGSKRISFQFLGEGIIDITEVFFTIRYIAKLPENFDFVGMFHVNKPIV